jgi:hypothetical protein
MIRRFFVHVRRWLCRQLCPCQSRPSRPGSVSFTVVGEKPMLTVRGTLPAVVGSTDVATRNLTLSITNPDGTVLDPVTISKPVAEPDFTFAVERNAVINCKLVDVDEDGNESEPSTSGPFTAKDTFPPAKPGEVSFAVIGQTP